ncbi:hypothetical protein RO3G_01989 [Rhizopus delemar RA 99-880]|uniref:Uncharacterized protein n=1 Tax=Rhizopus delemar (strain RA 99-880 / ATCC MYA-4621 / FGSC 9543 / NRRL 43880) TaxID=246409 RepID=I1BM55_RHIO9|nr:hypothetical protein RO3G_01989 [Rhizopus delemar RA 99-880]|eukprot:EIE77285.1 hypothetical protein RO3G_01989 [Rhizopus delemar RA 99-880]
MGIRTPITLNKRKVEGNAKRARKAASKKSADLKDIVIGHYMRVAPETFDKMKNSFHVFDKDLRCESI